MALWRRPYLSLVLRPQLPLEGGEQRGQDDPEVARESVSGHRGQEGQYGGVDGWSGQLERRAESLQGTASRGWWGWGRWRLTLGTR